MRKTWLGILIFCASVVTLLHVVSLPRTDKILAQSVGLVKFAITNISQNKTKDHFHYVYFPYYLITYEYMHWIPDALTGMHCGIFNVEVSLAVSISVPHWHYVLWLDIIPYTYRFESAEMLVQYGASPQLQNPKLEVSSYSQCGKILNYKIQN